MNLFLQLRLRNLSIAADQAGDGNVAALIMEALEELEKQDAEIRKLRGETDETS